MQHLKILQSKYTLHRVDDDDKEEEDAEDDNENDNDCNDKSRSRKSSLLLLLLLLLLFLFYVVLVLVETIWTYLFVSDAKKKQSTLEPAQTLHGLFQSHGSKPGSGNPKVARCGQVGMVGISPG